MRGRNAKDWLPKRAPPDRTGDRVEEEKDKEEKKEEGGTISRERERIREKEGSEWCFQVRGEQ